MSDPFPLPLTPLERFFRLDDQPCYPNHIVCRLRFAGRLDRDRFTMAFAEWGRRHAMSAVQVRSHRGRLSWVRPTDSAIPDLVWLEADDGDPGFPALPPLDLAKGPTTRVVIVERSRDTDVILQTHHATIDGVGGLQATQDLIVLYAAQFFDQHPRRGALHRVDPMRLADRNKHFRNWWEAIRQLPPQFIGLYGAIKYWARRAVPLSEPRQEPEADAVDHQPQLVTHLFSREDSERLRQFAQHNKATVNDVLIRDLLLAMRAWQDQRGIQRGRRVFRIMVPINLRTIADRRLGAANRVSMIYLDRTEQQLDRPKELLWGINFEMQTIVRFNLSLTFLAMIRILGWIPGLLKRQVKSRACRSTCILTNLGEPFGRSKFPRDEQGRARVGNVTLEGFDLLAPIRPRTAAAFSVFRYSGRTGITLHYDPLSLTPQEAGELLNRYVKRLHQSIERAARQQPSAESVS